MSADAKHDDKDTELSPTAKKFKDDAAKLKDFLASVGGMAALCYAVIEAITSTEPYKPILALSLALLFFGGLSIGLGETGYPRYGKRITVGLVILGLAGCVAVAFLLLSSPTLIKLFEIDHTPWKRPLAQMTPKKELRIIKAQNLDTKETLPGIMPESSSVLFLAIAKEKSATELVLQELTLELKDYKPLPKNVWALKEEVFTYAKSFDYSATLSHDEKSIYANHHYPTNPQIRDDFTVPIHVRLHALKPGIYTFACKVSVKCHKKTEERETETIRFVVVDPAERDEINRRIKEEFKREPIPLPKKHPVQE